MNWRSALDLICRPSALAQGLDLIGAGRFDPRQVRQPLPPRTEGRRSCGDHDWSRPAQTSSCRACCQRGRARGGQWQGPNNPDGWTKLVAWSRSLGTERQWGIEGAWSYGRGLAQKLVASGEAVFDINPRWTAERRRGARNTSKTDKRDAKAIASVEHVLGTRPSIHPETIG